LGDFDPGAIWNSEKVKTTCPLGWVCYQVTKHLFFSVCVQNKSPALRWAISSNQTSSMLVEIFMLDDIEVSYHHLSFTEVMAKGRDLSPPAFITHQRQYL
jgi:hypothetical protein